ncbi:MAG: hypothetical protein QOF58_1485 [Pseudonocardiales bacterium]|jgi:uncharacterized protein YraI|nr:hypothetical protein [Pseudonocardiales bacterium]
MIKLISGLSVVSALLAAGAGVAAADVRTTVDAHSNVRGGPYLKAQFILATKRVTSMNVECFERGDQFDDGRVNTDVWYAGTVYADGGNRYGYVWGGSVNTAQDPPPGLRYC